MNETDTITFPTSDAATNFLSAGRRRGLIPPSVSDVGFGPGVRFPGGLHSENAASINALQITATSHIDMFDPNGGLAPLFGHVFGDVVWGHLLTWLGGQQQSKLDRGC
jgi:hypothetical protein